MVIGQCNLSVIYIHFHIFPSGYLHILEEVTEAFLRGNISMVMSIQLAQGLKSQFFDLPSALILEMPLSFQHL